MKYISTRNRFERNLILREVFIKGLAEDGDLFIPKLVPKISEERIIKIKQVKLQRFSERNYFICLVREQLTKKNYLKLLTNPILSLVKKMLLKYQILVNA